MGMEKRIEELNLPLTDIIPNEENPRYITEDKLEKLIQSIEEFPEMTTMRPLVVNQDNILIGGNMRYKALQKLGYTDTKVIRVYGYTKEEQKEFLVKDNVGYGEWNWQLLLTDEWDIEVLDKWGMDFPEWLGQDDIMDLNLDGLGTGVETENTQEKIKTIKLKYTNEDYDNITNALKEINQDINQSVLEILNLQ